MTKNIIKEIIIVLLLALAIILILGVLLYEYVPANKIIPEKPTYITPDTVKEELQASSEVETTELDITYHIDSTDLSNYKKTQDYVPGKKNPFSTLAEPNQNLNENDGTSTSTNSSKGTTSSKNGTQTENNNSKTQNSTSTTSGYLPDKGTK